MYYFTKWDVLVVDDEPDVLAISQLAMEDLEVYGLPLVLHIVRTKAEAIELLHEMPDLATNLSLAFIDVVMETDGAGLELCNYIREDIGNRLTQIFIRTGQPGMAPEKEAIDRYELNGYFTKIEATEEKLYSLVKSGVRQFLWSHMAQFYLTGFNEILRSTHWQQKIKQVLVSYVESTPGVSNEVPLYIAFDNHVCIQQGVNEQQVAQWRQLSDNRNNTFLEFDKSHYACDSENRWSIHIMASEAGAEVLLLCHTAFAPPEDLIIMTYDFLQGLAALWKRSL